jgi:hypothetical protein
VKKAVNMSLRAVGKRQCGVKKSRTGLRAWETHCALTPAASRREA